MDLAQFLIRIPPSFNTQTSLQNNPTQPSLQNKDAVLHSLCPHHPRSRLLRGRHPLRRRAVQPVQHRRSPVLPERPGGGHPQRHQPPRPLGRCPLWTHWPGRSDLRPRQCDRRLWQLLVCTFFITDNIFLTRLLPRKQLGPAGLLHRQQLQ